MKLFVKEHRTEEMYYNKDGYVVFGKSTTFSERTSWYVLLNLPFIKAIRDYIDPRTFNLHRGKTYLRVLLSVGAHPRFLVEWYPVHRQLAATYTLEPIDDLDALHGLDVEQELVNILIQEINADNHDKELFDEQSWDDKNANKAS